MGGFRYLLDSNSMSDLIRHPGGKVRTTLALDLTLVTDSVDEFARGPGLSIENWFARLTRSSRALMTLYSDQRPAAGDAPR